MIRNPLYAFGCWANGAHVWSKKYAIGCVGRVSWEHACLWCNKIEPSAPPRRCRKHADRERQ